MGRILGPMARRGVASVLGEPVSNRTGLLSVRVTLSIRHQVLRLALRDPFLIARSDHDGGHAITTVIVEVRDERFPGVIALGEGYPDRFYGETVDTMAAVFPLLVAAVDGVQPPAVVARAARGRR